MDERPTSGWIGTILQDKWRIEAKIARGGVATVFRAADVRHEHGDGQPAYAAIKIMHPEYSRNADVRRRFLREGYAANKVGHPNVVQIIGDDVTPDGSAFLVMELLQDAEELEARRENAPGGRLPLIEVARICDQVLDVLAAAHEKGIIHRDIKPENIMILKDGTVKVLDFGIAHIKEAAIAGGFGNPARVPVAIEHEPTATGLLLGTPEYMSPEQAMGKRGQIDAKTDIFSVGAMMFTLLSGQAVHVHDVLSVLLVAVTSRQARSLAAATNAVPPEVIAIVDKALALEKHRRWATARDMQAALRKAVPQAATRKPLLAQTQKNNEDANELVATSPLLPTSQARSATVVVQPPLGGKKLPAPLLPPPTTPRSGVMRAPVSSPQSRPPPPSVDPVSQATVAMRVTPPSHPPPSGGAVHLPPRPRITANPPSSSPTVVMPPPDDAGPISDGPPPSVTLLRVPAHPPAPQHHFKDQDDDDQRETAALVQAPTRPPPPSPLLQTDPSLDEETARMAPLKENEPLDAQLEQRTVDLRALREKAFPPKPVQPVQPVHVHVEPPFSPWMPKAPHERAAAPQGPSVLVLAALSVLLLVVLMFGGCLLMRR